MCGIVGILNLNGQPYSDSSSISRMVSQLHHRGPDDEGHLIDGPVAFGFRRLSIIDVDGGHQPVHNEDKSVWAMCNGEIYNYVELRETLESYGHVFSTNGDTETIVHAYEQWGLHFVERLRGMFALGLWDSARRKLVVARDRIGKKPLYYSVNAGQLAFASELKSLLNWPGVDSTLDMSALKDYLRFLYVPAPRSILKGVHKLLPGHLLVADAESGSVESRRYWTFQMMPDAQQPEKYFKEGLRHRLEEAVRIRLRSDVPLGAFLSGGLDSSTVVALMAKQQNYAPLTFSMGFQDQAYDETSFARLLAQSIGSDHFEEIVEPVTPEMLQRIVWHLDEPFADSSAIPTYLVCQAARRHVTVALSGDGGDELFAGYNRYRHFRWINRLDGLPLSVRRALRATTGRVSKKLAPLAPAMADRLRQLSKAIDASLLPSSERSYFLKEYFDHGSLEALLVDDVRATSNDPGLEQRMASMLDGAALTGDIDAFLYLDTVAGLPDDMLTKVDRMSMAHGLEVRCPLLDQEVIEFSGTIPSGLKLHNGQGKYVLKQAVRDIVPPEILNRKKRGFSVPFGPWLATTFRDVVADCLSSESVRNRGLFQPEEILKLRELALGTRSWRDSGLSQHQVWHRTWAVLMLELWFREVFEHSSHASKKY